MVSSLLNENLLSNKTSALGPTVSCYTEGKVHAESQTWRHGRPCLFRALSAVHGENSLLNRERGRGTARPLGRTQAGLRVHMDVYWAGSSVLPGISVPSAVRNAKTEKRNFRCLLGNGV